MKKFKKFTALLLTLVLVLGMLPMVSFAEEGNEQGGNTGDNSPVVLSKTYDSENQVLTLEAYTTGETVVTSKPVPCDIVLVLDASLSMNSNYTYVEGYKEVDSCTVNDILKSTYYVHVGDKYYKVEYEASYSYNRVDSLTCSNLRSSSYSWSLLKNGNAQYYYLVGDEYKEMYYRTYSKSSGFFASTTYYYFAYNNGGNDYIALLDTSSDDGVTDSVNLAARSGNPSKIYSYSISGYSLYYTDENNQKVFLTDEPVSSSSAYNGSLTLYSGSTKTKTRIEALKAAVNSFIDIVAENAKGANKTDISDDVDHRISIIKFSADNDTSTTVLNGLTSVIDIDGYNTIKSYTDKMSLVAGTAADRGMAKATDVIDGIDKDRKSNKVVILFTDGVPTTTGTGTVNDFQKSRADLAINYSNALKSNGVTVYSIGLFGSEAYNNGKLIDNLNNYMEGVSSDYPNATTIDNLGDKAADSYFIDAAKDSSDLSEIFQNVANESTGGTISKLDKATVLLDIASKYFRLPDNASDSIEAYCFEQIGLEKVGDENFVPIFSDTPIVDEESKNIKIGIEGKTVSVNGFDYAKYYVTTSVPEDGLNSFDGTNVNNVKGRKLVVKIPIVPDSNAFFSSKVPLVDQDVKSVDEDNHIADVYTNDATSGIYTEDGKIVKPFDRPSGDVNLFTVQHVGDTAYAPESDYVKTYHVYADGETFDLTTAVTDGNLYGGTFIDWGPETYCTVPASDDATEFNPAEGETYYMWEVSPEHLMPKNLCAYRSDGNGGYYVEDVYLVTAIDRAMYQRFGFAVSKDNALANLSADKIMDKCDPDGTIELHSMIDLFDKIEVSQEGEETICPRYCDLYPNAKTTAPSEATESMPGRNASCIACYHLGSIAGDPFYKYTASNPFYFRAFWETKDGVIVFGSSTRKASYQNAYGTALNVTDDESLPIVEPVDKVLGTQSASAAPLRVSNAYSYDSTYESMLTTIPLKALLPEVEKEPEIPVEPADYVEVSDNGKTYKAMILNGAVTLEPAGAGGKLFAGWYLDENFTKAADLTSVKDGDTIYAKYISDAYLNVKYTDSILLKRLSLISAIDARDYAKTGFIVEIGGEKKVINVSSYTNSYLLVSAKTLFGSSIAKNSPLMTCDLSLSGVKKNSTIKITPFAITKDGTEILGEERTLVYTGFSIKG